MSHRMKLLPWTLRLGGFGVLLVAALSILTGTVTAHSPGACLFSGGSDENGNLLPPASCNENCIGQAQPCGGYGCKRFLPQGGCQLCNCTNDIMNPGLCTCAG